jgi:hypothetical protein
LACNSMHARGDDASHGDVPELFGTLPKARPALRRRHDARHSRRVLIEASAPAGKSISK